LFIALACAVEPLAAKDCLPPQSTLAPAAYARVAWELLHAVSAMAPAASKLMAADDRLRFTLIASSSTMAPGVGDELGPGGPPSGHPAFDTRRHLHPPNQRANK
jgi:hypothetical protein